MDWILKIKYSLDTTVFSDFKLKEGAADVQSEALFCVQAVYYPNTFSLGT